MNWSLLLSEYPSPVLSNEHAVILLALIERSGVTTEEDLRDRWKLQAANLADLLLELSSTQLIRFGRKSVRATERGKIVLERLNLHNAIIDDLVKLLPVRKDEVADCRRIFVSYRQDAFSHYLDSLGTVRLWETVVKRFKGSSTKESEDAIKAGSLALIFWDLRHWAQHANVDQAEFGKLSDQLRLFLFHREPKELQIATQPAKHKQAFRWINSLSKLYRIRASDTPMTLENELERTFVILHSHIHHQARPGWLDSCLDADITDFLQRDASFQAAPTSGDPWWTWSEAEIGLRGARKNPLEWLTSVFFATSIEDLAASMKLSTPAAQTLVEQLRDRCDQLLAPNQLVGEASKEPARVERRDSKQESK